MALTITEQEGTFYLKGNINTSTSILFDEHFKYVLNVYAEIAINIHGLKEIDMDGFLSLKKIQNYAVSKGKKITIEGYNIVQDQNINNVA
jgi:ABC-type transporter Mla MlaB component